MAFSPVQCSYSHRSKHVTAKTVISDPVIFLQLLYLTLACASFGSSISIVLLCSVTAC